MEQFLSNRMEELAIRGFSVIPNTAEADGYIIDVTGGLRGLLRKPRSAEYINNNNNNNNNNNISSPTYPQRQPWGAITEFPQRFAEVTCTYDYIYNDIIIDSSSEIYNNNNNNNEPFIFTVGAGQVTRGFDEAAMMTAIGETTEWYLDPIYAFRDGGFNNNNKNNNNNNNNNNNKCIPPNAAVKLKITIISFQNPMSSYEKLMYATELKDIGNYWFAKREDNNNNNNNNNNAVCSKNEDNDLVKSGNDNNNNLNNNNNINNEDNGNKSRKAIVEATLYYQKALRTIGRTFTYELREKYNNNTDNNNNIIINDNIHDEPPKEAQQAMDKALRISLNNNLSTCFYYTDDIIRATRYNDEVLKYLDNNNAKALYRLVLIYEKQQEYGMSLDVLENRMLANNIGNKEDIINKIAQLRGVYKKQCEKAGRMYARMVEGGLSV